MATGAEHYKEAERLAQVGSNASGPLAVECITAAQVHATLALAAATATSVVLQLPISSDIAKPWAQAIELPGGAA